ncbi:MAG: methionine synthase [Bacteroidales bacterium]
MKGIREILSDRILILDGAMGTMIQQHQLQESDYRGDRFANSDKIQKGNNDILSLTRADIIESIHDAYLEAGADIIETNSFNSTSISMEDYGCEGDVFEINFQAARIARRAADKWSKLTPEKPRFVAGSVGPTNKTCSISPNVDDPAYRSLSFDDLRDAYIEQMSALIKGGVDVLLIETIFDTLNAKAAISAAEEAIRNSGKRVEIMLSVTIADKGGRTLSGQTLEAFLVSIEHANILSIGLNCSFGAKDIMPFLRELNHLAPNIYISTHPNAGLPNRFGEYDETPEKMADQLAEFINQGLVNILGGCCGTTPQHIAKYQELVNKASVRKLKQLNRDKELNLSGLEKLVISPENNFINIGERCNVAGSRKFLRLIKERKFDEALSIARKQVEDGAQVIDVNMDDGMLDAKEAMVTFLRLISSDPDICRVPIMIDSSKWDVIVAGIKSIQGKSIVNSISLKEGEMEFIAKALTIKSLGAAVVVMAFDEYGQADSFIRRVDICQRAYKILTEIVGMKPTDIIFDPNILAIATGIDEHKRYGIDFIKTVLWIKENLPGAKVSGGVSNLSFSFRGNNYIREVMHSVFLYHSIKAGMDMGIVNPSESINYDDISANLLERIEDVIFDRYDDATDRLIEIAQDLKEEASKQKECKKDEWRDLPLEDRVIHSLLKGIGDYLEDDLRDLLPQYPKAIEIIEKVLMVGMNRVGELFGEGKMFLPQVVKTARTMKRAVSFLEPIIESQKESSSPTKAGKIIIATVKGDVHDIGKNIVGVILACNNYDVIDLGVMVSHEEILERTLAENPDFVGLSGLITPSLEEMSTLASLFEKSGLKVPILVGGATTSKLHTAVKIAPCYSGAVIHTRDASMIPGVLSKWSNMELRKKLELELKEEQAKLREKHNRAVSHLSKDEAIAKGLKFDWDSYSCYKPRVEGINTISISVGKLIPYINWRFFFHTWKLSGRYAEIAEIHGCDSCRASWLISFPENERQKASEAMQLHKDAMRLLNKLAVDEYVSIEALFAILPAKREGEEIIFFKDDQTIHFPFKRQSRPNENDECLSLVDFVSPKKDYVGGFATTIGRVLESMIIKQKTDGEYYQLLLLQSIADRLVEAAAEWIHEMIRREFWGYDPDENLAIEELYKCHYQGIRPAIGYPSIPDQSSNFILNDLIEFSRIGIRLSENGAMIPASSVSGLIISHPNSKYFVID